MNLPPARLAVVFGTALVLTVGLLARPAIAQEEIDQVFDGPFDGFDPFDPVSAAVPGQIFTPSFEELSAVEVFVEVPSDKACSGYLRLTVREVELLEGGGIQLGSEVDWFDEYVELDGSEEPYPVIDFETDLDSLSKDAYAITVAPRSVDESLDDCGGWSWSGEIGPGEPDPYPGGVAFRCKGSRCNVLSRDFGFATFHWTEPEDEPPVAMCQDLTVDAGPTCIVSVSVDDGSYDPDGDPFTPLQYPEEFTLGEQTATLTVSNDGGESTCTGTVTVYDATEPVLAFDGHDVPPWDAPIAFAVDASDNCGLSDLDIDVQCSHPHWRWWWGWWERPCRVSVDGNVVTVHRTGGVGTAFEVEAEATDTSGNVGRQTFRFEVVRPWRHHDHWWYRH